MTLSAPSKPERILYGGPDWQALRGEFVEAQCGRCAICDREMQQPHLDHCHATGFIRGALCPSCNQKLGWFEANRQAVEQYLLRAGEYQAHHERRTRKQWLREYWLGRDVR